MGNLPKKYFNQLYRKIGIQSTPHGLIRISLFILPQKMTAINLRLQPFEGLL